MIYLIMLGMILGCTPFVICLLNDYKRRKKSFHNLMDFYFDNDEDISYAFEGMEEYYIENQKKYLERKLS